MNLSAKTPFLLLAGVVIAFSLLLSAPVNAAINQDINIYFSTIDDAFVNIVDAGALRSTNLKQAERLFIREMRKNRSFHTFVRVNSKGAVISEVIRGEKVERPMRNVADQRWFTNVSEKRDPWYSLVKDDDRGRYYLVWSRPVVKQGDRFVGAVMLKIDLWDCFYEYSNSTYAPFLVKLGKKSLFSHKWKEGTTGTEAPLDIKGIGKISVLYGTDAAAPAVASVNDSANDAVFTVADSEKTPLPEKKAKKGTSGVMVFFLVVLIIGIVGVSTMLIVWMRKHALARHEAEEESIF